MTTPIRSLEASALCMPGVSASSAFILASNDFVTTLLAIADRIASCEPGTAAILTAYAEREAGLAVDLVQGWP